MNFLRHSYGQSKESVYSTLSMLNRKAEEDVLERLLHSKEKEMTRVVFTPISRGMFMERKSDIERKHNNAIRKLDALKQCGTSNWTNSLREAKRAISEFGKSVRSSLSPRNFRYRAA